jgi:hypothetical protein
MRSIKLFRCCLLIVALVMTFALAPQVSAHVGKSFASKGATELGGNISFQSVSGLSIFSFTPSVGYFVGDGFELGLDPLGISTVWSGGSASTQLTILAAPSYNFVTNGFVYPFIGALLGYTHDSGGSKGGFTWGGSGGVKFAVTSGALIDLALQDTGSNHFSISAGLSLWF